MSGLPNSKREYSDIFLCFFVSNFHRHPSLSLSYLFAISLQIFFTLTFFYLCCKIPLDIYHFHFLTFVAHFLRYRPARLLLNCGATCLLEEIKMLPFKEKSFFVISMRVLFLKYYIRPIFSTMCAFTKLSNCETLFCKSNLTRTPWYWNSIFSFYELKPAVSSLLGFIFMYL